MHEQEGKYWRKVIMKNESHNSNLHVVNKKFYVVLMIKVFRFNIIERESKEIQLSSRIDMKCTKLKRQTTLLFTFY